MTEILIEVATSVTSKIAELLVESTISQFRYLFYFKSIIDELKAEEEDLKPAMTQVQNEVNKAINNAEVIEEHVRKWMTDTATVMEEVQRLKDEIQQDKRCFNKCCPNWLWRHRLSKKAAKKTKVLKELAEKGKFTTVSHPALLPDIEFLPSKDFTLSRSSKEALNQIMEALKDDNISMIGLYGMGGVGKTTLAKEVANRVKELKLFDEVVFVVVSQNADFIKIQDQIADKLGLKLEERSVQGRANHLTLRLQDERKKLIILDDVWKYLSLKDIGILFRDDQKNCKILLTTRLRNVCISMDCQKKIPLNILNEDEALVLFKKTAGLRDDQLNLHKVAMEVAKECKGLPIAIVTVGRALKQKQTLWEWQEALRKLKASRLTEIRDMDEEKNAYACLKFSFDVHRVETRSCLLLCSLYPEDSKIFVEDLVIYAVGLDLYKDAQTMEITRNEVLGAIADLKNSCMLLETEQEGYVKMHDVVRDFTLWIGCQVEKVFIVKTYNKFSEWKMRSEDHKAVSIMDDEDFAKGLVCPKLELLLQLKESFRGKSNNVDDDFFREMKQLKVVSLNEASLSTQSLEFLNNLQILVLVRCEINDNFGPTLMVLKRLQILRCWFLDIKELPNEVGELEKLKVLDLQHCRQLQRISYGIIQKLCRLEELYLTRSFSNWDSSEVINEETRNASLIELNWLPHLAILWLTLDETNIPRDLMFPKLSGYNIHVSCLCRSYFTKEVGHPKPNQLCVVASKVNACKMLLQNVRELKLWTRKWARSSNSLGNLIPDMDASGINDLISLDVRNLEMECLVDAKLWQQQQVQPQIGFSNLKELSMQETTIKKICNGQPPQGFLNNLTYLSLWKCNNLKSIFSPSIARSLLHLQELYIEDCTQLKHIISTTEMEEGTSLSKGKTIVGNDLKLPYLKTIDIRQCPSLEYVLPISVAPQGLSRLEKITLWDNGNLKSVFENETNNNAFTSTTIVLRYYLGLPEAILLPKLKSLYFGECLRFFMYCAAKIWIPQKALINSKQLANDSPAHVIQLENLRLIRCSWLEHVIAMDENDRLSFKIHFQDQCHLLPCFSNLVNIEISFCNRLKSVFPIILIISGLPALYALVIKDCFKLVEVFDGVEDEADKNNIQQKQISFQKLSRLTLDNLPSLVNFCPPNYHFIFSFLEKLKVKGCPKMTTIFTIAPNKVVHSKTKAPQEGSSSTSIDIDWPYKSNLPRYKEDEEKAIQPIVC